MWHLEKGTTEERKASVSKRAKSRHEKVEESNENDVGKNIMVKT